MPLCPLREGVDFRRDRHAPALPRLQDHPLDPPSEQEGLAQGRQAAVAFRAMGRLGRILSTILAWLFVALIWYSAMLGMQIDR
jgi:hypothetical protein